MNGTYLETLQKVSLKTEAVELATLNLEHTDSSSWQFTLSHEDRVSAEKHAVLSLAASLGLAQTEAAAAISLNAAATLSLTLRF